MDTTVHAKLLAMKAARYSLYVFQNIDTHEYIMCTQLPNWKEVGAAIGDTGFLTYEIAIRGETYLTKDMRTEIYKYSNVYFKDFIKDNKTIDIIL